MLYNRQSAHSIFHETLLRNFKFYLGGAPNIVCLSCNPPNRNFITDSIRPFYATLTIDFMFQLLLGMKLEHQFRDVVTTSTPSQQGVTPHLNVITFER